MIRGLYTSTMGLQDNEKRLEIISNNLANVNTNGFKKDKPATSSFSDVMTQIIGGEQEESGSSKKNIGKLALGVGINEVVTDYKQGSLVKTDNPLDFAITNSNLSFFCIDVANGSGQTQEMYTRDGAFTINSLGQLVTKDGNIVKGENGSITLKGTNINVNSDGTIVEDGQVVDKLLIKEFADSKGLKKQGNNLIADTANSQTEESNGQIVQGSTETSNVNSINEMVDMINVMRAYESNQKVLQAHDQTLQKAVNEVGKL